MKKRNFKILIILFISSGILLSLWTLPISNGAATEIVSVFGESPNINGEIDTDLDEWEEVEFTKLYLKTSPTDSGLPIDFKAIQDKDHLYFLIQYNLEIEEDPNGFIAILISNSSSTQLEYFEDAKIVNISTENYSFNDYYINKSIFSLDSNTDGKGAGMVIIGDELEFTYEFSLPTSSSESDDRDVMLEYNSEFAFNISQGIDPLFPEGIRRSTQILIEIQEPKTKPPFDIDALVMGLVISVFSINGVLYGFYIYRIVLLKKKIKRIRS